MKKICLSGAITGHEAEARLYFAEAERIVQERYPLAKIFNPTRLPRQKNWSDYMTICLNRISSWADGIVFIINRYAPESVGVETEYEAAKKAGLEMLNLENGKLTKLQVEA